jgi:hypothetical protein
MKNLVLVILLIAFGGQAFCQKKGKVDPKDLTIDSLKTVNTTMNLQLDSISKQKEVYLGMYKVIRDEIIKHEFDPANTKALLDSLRATIEADNSLLTSASASLSDSLKIVKEENMKLKAELESLSSFTVDKTPLEKELLQLKGLLDSKIISEEEFEEKKKIILNKWK